MFPDARGCDILQRKPTDGIIYDGVRAKNRTVISKKNKNNFAFIGVIFPFTGYCNRIDELSIDMELSGWLLNQSMFECKGAEPIVLSRNKEHCFFGVNTIKH
jgi:hypothetical protein